MLLVRDDQQPTFSLIKEQRRAIEKITGGRANFFLCHAIYQYYAAIDWQVADRDRRIEHPCSRGCWSSDPNDLSGDVELDIIGVAVEQETMLTYDMTKREQVEGEQKRTQHRALGDASGL